MIVHYFDISFCQVSTLHRSHFIVLSRKRVRSRAGNVVVLQQTLKTQMVLTLLKGVNMFLTSTDCPEMARKRLEGVDSLLHIIFPTNGHGYTELSSMS